MTIQVVGQASRLPNGASRPRRWFPRAWTPLWQARRLPHYLNSYETPDPTPP
jgi:hypothetical protein